MRSPDTAWPQVAIHSLQSTMAFVTDKASFPVATGGADAGLEPPVPSLASVSGCEAAVQLALDQLEASEAAINTGIQTALEDKQRQTVQQPEEDHELQGSGAVAADDGSGSAPTTAALCGGGGGGGGGDVRGASEEGASHHGGGHAEGRGD
mmetsp:Transcript_14487/g.42773  ORF Transcript_14487/g.42773 Transcript_14487/m.42773 type:complete len:151 (-) Transcript_14487:75-527(-)